MNYRVRKVILILWWVATVCTGCATKESIYRDIRESRTASFGRWKSAFEGKADEGEDVLKGKLGVSESIQIALGNNKPLQGILEEKAKAKGMIVEAMSYAMPTATVEGTYRKTDKVPTISFGGLPGMGANVPALGMKDNWSYGVSLKQPIYTGGATTAAIRGAKIFQFLADERIRNVAQEVIFDSRKAYYDVLLQSVLMEVAETSLRVAEEHLSEVQKRKRGGVASDFDVLRAEVEVTNYRALAIESKNKEHLARTSLFKVLGVSQESNVELVDALAYKPARAELVEVVEKALSERPDLFQAELEVRLQKEAIKVAKAGWLPKVFLFADWEATKPSQVNMGNLGWDEEWSGGVKTEIPIFDGLKTLGKVMQEKATLRQKEINLRDAEERALLEARQAYLSLRDAEEFVESQQASLDRAKEGFRLAQVGYRNGINTQVEVLDAQEALTRARGNYYKAVYDHMLAKLYLERATGALAPKEVDVVTKNTTVPPADEGRAKEQKPK
ncbi:MAG: TolC family protein [Planctomycetota bacterium]